VFTSIVVTGATPLITACEFPTKTSKIERKQQGYARQLISKWTLPDVSFCLGKLRPRNSSFSY